MTTIQYRTAYVHPEMALWPTNKPLPEGWVWVNHPDAKLRATVTKLNKACARHKRKLRGLRDGRQLDRDIKNLMADMLTKR